MTTKWNNAKPGSKTWVHSAAALTAGHVVYNIKYLGCVEVTAPKGADIVKEAVTKLKFNKQVKRSEGAKPPKRELTISVDGVTIQEKQTKKMDTNKEQCEKHHSYPLHHISYCADDKSDKKICAFIAKDVKDNKHMCHVMESDKNAEEITLTVGQAFDLAYQKFLSNANMTQEQKMQNETLQRRVRPSGSPRMGRIYSHGTFAGHSPPVGRATPPLRGGTPPRLATPPNGAATLPCMAAHPKLASSADPTLPPPPPALIESPALVLHPPPPSPPPPPTSPAPLSSLTFPPPPDTTDYSGTPDNPQPDRSPNGHPAGSDPPEGIPSERPSPPYDLPPEYVPKEILSTKL